MPTLRDYRPADADVINRLAPAAFAQYAGDYNDWPAMRARLSRMADLAASGEIIIAEHDGTIVGAVCYVPAATPKPAHFDPGWPIIRLLVVDPAARGLGVGRRLTEACIARARRDGAAAIALHTSAIMTVALPMYLRLGFVFVRDAPANFGVPYAVYVKTLAGSAITGL